MKNMLTFKKQMLAYFQAALPVREGQPSTSISMQPKRAGRGLIKKLGHNSNMNTLSFYMK